MFSAHFEEPLTSFHLSKELEKVIPDDREVVIVCIGTDRSSGDSLGPLVGYHLARLHQFHVYGTLEQPVHAQNLIGTLDWIRTHHDHPFIIAVDACLGSHKRVGSIFLKDGGVHPGAGVGKKLPAVGDIHIGGIVNVAGFASHHLLQSTRLHTVMEMSKIISNALFLSLRKKTKETIQ